MKKFPGFPARMQFTPVPDLFLNRIMPEITDPAELKVTLYILSLLYHKRGYSRFVAFTELLGFKPLVASLGGEAEKALSDALDAAVQRGTILRLPGANNTLDEKVFFLNDPAGRDAVEKINRGEVKLPGIKSGLPAPPPAEPSPDIFTLYEDNIGMLTPLIADELRQAEKLYPEGWIGDAIKEAITHNKRNWRYISAILERWSREGRADGAYKGYSERDPDRYIKGRYGHLVQR